MTPNPRSRALATSSSLFSDRERKILRGDHQHHAAVTIRIFITGHPAPLGSASSSPSAGTSPYSTRETETKPRLLSTERDRPPLSQSLRPARPLEERQRGAGGEQKTLKALFTHERGGGGK
jgi:hypothetical protein